jgi:transcriptional activator SPT7
MQNHPLRPCVKRLQVKAERLLKHITDRKERTDPPIPSDLPSSTGVARPRTNGANGYRNGRAPSHTRSPSLGMGYSPMYKAVSAKSRRDIPFSDTPAIVRTPEGMAMFMDLDREVGAAFPKSALAHTLRELAPPMEYGSEGEEETAVGGASLGEKRKSGASDRRPRKKARFIAQYPTPLEESDDVSQLWWGAVQSDALLGNGLPGIPFGPSSSKQKKVRTTPKPKRAKKTEQLPPPNPKSLLTMMNTNIKTMRRLRHTHAKFAALNAATAPPEDEEQGAESGMFTATGPGTAQRPLGTATAPPLSFGMVDDDVVDEKIDEEPWTAGKGKGKSKVSGIELGEENAMDCMHWSTNKILEHAGFQGMSSSKALLCFPIFDSTCV